MALSQDAVWRIRMLQRQIMFRARVSLCATPCPELTRARPAPARLPSAARARPRCRAEFESSHGCCVDEKVSPRAIKLIRIARLITTFRSLDADCADLSSRARARRARRVVLRADALATDVDLFERALRKSSNDVLGQNDARRRLEPFPSDMTRYRKLALALGARRLTFKSQPGSTPRTT